MQKIIFSSDHLPSNLDDSARFSLWRDIYIAQYGTSEISRLPDAKFVQHSEFAQVGALGVTRSSGAVTDIVRADRHAAADTRGDFLIGFNCGDVPIGVNQRDQETILTQGRAVFLTSAEAVESHCRGVNHWGGIAIPRALLLERLPRVENMLGAALSPQMPAARHLLRYAAFLLGADEIGTDAAVMEHAAATLLDLVVLALGADRDAAGVAKLRGLRAARAQEVLLEIKRSFARQTFSVSDVAAKVGISPRYVQELLQQTGIGFTERVLELRLQRARAMLSSPQQAGTRIAEIAHACGFNDISYFNVSFRRRFGATPTQYRSAGIGQGNGQE